jgi:hypothetical protein
MAYARFGKDSDVYIYASSEGGYACDRCSLPGAEVSQRLLRSSAEAIEHLLAHRSAGQKVPDRAIREIESDEEERL